jgi:disulfide bond formation protein DsbB
MTSLTEVYEGGAGGADLRRLYGGVALFLLGAVLTVTGIVLGTSAGAAGVAGLDKFASRELAGVVAGLGLPATFLGAIIVLPKASSRIRTAAVVGTLVSIAGVGLFTEVYPYQWYGQPTDYTMPVTALYFLGVITTFWCLFVAVANFKARNDPGGTVRLEVTKEGKTKVIEVSNDRLRQGLGGIGLLGSTPDGETPTQTNGTNTARSDGGAEVSHATAPPSGNATPQSTPDAEIMRDEPAPQGDVYCGNCAHFSYVRTDDGLQPYCGLHAEAMDDMDACSQWEANN